MGRKNSNRKKRKIYNVFNPFEIDSEVFFRNSNSTISHGKVLSFSVSPSIRMAHYRINDIGERLTRTKPFSLNIHLTDTEREGFDYEISTNLIYTADDVNWVSSWRDHLVIGQSLYDKCPYAHENKEVLLLRVEGDILVTQSMYERQVRTFNKYSDRIRPIFQISLSGEVVPSIHDLHKSTIPMPIYPKNEWDDEYFGCKCLVNGEEGHVIDVNYTTFSYCVIFNENISFHLSNRRWGGRYQGREDEEGNRVFDISWHTRDEIEILERDPIHQRRHLSISKNGEAPVISFDVAQAPHILKAMSEAFENDPMYVFLMLCQLGVTDGGIDASPMMLTYNSLSYTPWLDTYDNGVWRAMLEADFGYLPSFHQRLNLMSMKKARSIPIFEFEPVGFKIGTSDGIATVDVKVTYNGVYDNEVKSTYHLAITNHLLPITSRLFPMSRDERRSLCTDVLDYNFYVKRLSMQYSKGPQERQKNGLHGYQAFLLERMVAEERNGIFLSEIFNQSFDGFRFNRLEGFGPTWHEKANGGILSLAPGLGKTVVIVELIFQCLDTHGKTMVVVPPVLLDQWKKEFSTRAPSLKVTEYYRHKKDCSGDVVLTTYKMLVGNYQCIRTLPVFDRVVFDESHVLKTFESGTLHACSRINARARWCVTATPCQGNLLLIGPQLAMMQICPFKYNTDEWTMQHFYSKHSICFRKLMRRIVFEVSKERLKELDELPFENDIYEENVFLDLRPDIAMLVATLLRNYRDKFEYYLRTFRRYPLNEISKAIDNILVASMEPNLLPLSAFAKACLDGNANEATLTEIISRIDKSSTSTEKYRGEIKQNLLKAAADTDELCVICFDKFEKRTLTPCFHSFCHSCIKESLRLKESCPTCRKRCVMSDVVVLVDETHEEQDGEYIITDSFGKRFVVEENIKSAFEGNVPSRKFEWVLNNSDKFNKEGACTVVFSRHVGVLSRLKKYLGRTSSLNVGMITGSVGRSLVKKTLQDFEELKIPVLLLSTRVASIGLNLTTASHIIFLEPVLKEETRLQSIGRLNRIGQHKNIHIHNLHFNNGIETVYPSMKKTLEKHLTDLEKTTIGKKYETEKKRLHQNTTRAVFDTALLWVESRE
jgi:superfamily II DNA or RNA helicase